MEFAKLESMSALVDALDAGKKFTASFECGGDETIVSFFLDGKMVHWDDPPADVLFQILVDEYELPNAGEFFLNGNGTFTKKGNKLFMEYEFTTHGYYWDPNSDEEHVVEEEKLSGNDEIYEF